MSVKKIMYMVSGSWPPDVCGVGDYMQNVSCALEKFDCTVQKITLKKFDFFTLFKILLLVSFNKNARIFLSYPTEGYGKSILPFLFSLIQKRKLLVHIHEYSSKNKYCRFLLRLFRRFSVVYFSNKNDMNSYLRDIKRTANENWRVIPSPSNIPVVCDGFRKKHNKVIHFGQIRPNKGLEVVYDVFSKLSKTNNFSLFLIGAVPSGYEEYADNIRSDFEQIGCCVSFNLPVELISRELGTSHFGLFPFPDGADERRGSLNAALKHNVICVTTYSGKTSLDIKEATYGVDITDRLPEVYLRDLCAFFSNTFDEVETIKKIDKAIKLSNENSFERIASLILADTYNVAKSI